MAFASGSEVRTALVAESTFGTTPATPSFKTFRATSGGLRTQKSTGTSNERQADRNVRDEFQLGQDVNGSYDFELTYGGVFDDILEALLGGTWSTNVLKNGVTRRSFTVEETYELGATDTYRRFTGCALNTMSLSIGSRASVTGSLGIMGAQEALATAIVSGATYAASSTTPISTASANVASLAILGLSPVPTVRSLQLQISNNLRTRPSVGTLYSAEFGVGRFDVTGTLEAYFESNALYTQVLNHGNGALSFTVGNTAGSKYTFALPKIILGDGNITAGGNDDDIMASIPFRAVYDTTELASLKITRAV